MCTNENEKLLIDYENFNKKIYKKILTGDGVQLFFSNVFTSRKDDKLPEIKPKLKKILVDFGLCQTYLEINQTLNFIKVWYKDESAQELKNFLLQKFNQNENNQSIELSISLVSSLVTPPDKGKIKTYTGLTKLLFQEFISASTSISLIDDNPFNEIKLIIQKGNLAASKPLESILMEGVD